MKTVEQETIVDSGTLVNIKVMDFFFTSWRMGDRIVGVEDPKYEWTTDRKNVEKISRKLWS